MAEYDFIAGPRKGKVWKEKYYLRNKKNFIQEAKKYIPINSQWLTKEEFKNYILSLLDKGIPQIYVLQELPEELYPYALIFVQNQQGTSIYVDKEGIRTQINIGDGNYDAVDIVNEVPEAPRDNTVYFVNDDQVNKNKDKNENLDCDIYVCDNNELRKVTIKDPDVDLIKEVIEEIKTKSLANVYNANLAINELVSTDNNGQLQASGINSSTASTVVNGVNTKSLKNIYNTTLTTDKIVSTDSNGCLTASDISNTDAKDVIDNVKNKCLKYVYNQTLTAHKLLGTGASGTVYATTISDSTAADVITGVSTKCLKKIYNQTLGTWKLLATDGDGNVVVTNKYSVNGTLTMSGTTIGMLNVLRNFQPLNFYKTSFDVYGRCVATETFSLPHLYLHKIMYDRAGAGEINFVIYNTQSTAMSLTDIYNFLVRAGCTEPHKYYPISGNIANGIVVSGIYASIYSAGSLSQREFSVVFYEGSNAYTERWIYFSGADSDTVVQIF